MKIDVLLVKYTPDSESEMLWNKTLGTVSKWNTGVLIRDNNYENIGLVKARNILLEKSEADIVVLMDFDFTEIDVDIEAMAGKALECGVVVPRDSRRKGWANEWETFEDCYCNFMVIRRELAGELDESFFMAYSDWGLLNKVAKNGCIRHNRSVVTHEGLSGTSKEKKRIWSEDFKKYNGKSWRPR